MQEGTPIEGLRDETPAKRKGMPKGGWPKKTPARPPLHEEREEIRPAIRSSSAREAEEYAAQVLSELGDSIDQNDEFYIDLNSIPEGWTYQWKAVEIAGKANTYHMNAQARNGWRPVPVTRHPEVFPPGSTEPVKKGLMLMELPTILVERSKHKLEKEARSQLRNAEAQLHETPSSPGQAPREEYPEHLKVVKRDFMRPVSAADNSEG